MRRPGSDKVYETYPAPFEKDVLIRPARRRRKARLPIKTMNWTFEALR